VAYDHVTRLRPLGPKDPGVATRGIADCNDMATTLAWYGLAAIGLVSALMVVTLRNVMYSALCLVMALVSVAGMFMLLDADFLALVQVLLYAGGVMVLVLFAIFLTQHIMETGQSQTNDNAWVAGFTCAVLGVLVFMAVKGTSFTTVSRAELPLGTAPPLGELLLSKYVFPFEVASVVLLAAIVGVVMIAGRQK